MTKRKRVTCSNCGKKGHNRTRCVENVVQPALLSQSSLQEDAPLRPQNDDPLEIQILEKDLTEGHNSEQPTSKRLRQEVYSQEEKSEAHVLLEPEARAEREKAAQGARAESSLQSASRGQAVLARFQEANAGAEEEAAQGARAESKLPSQASLAPIQETNARAEQAEAAVPEEEEKRRVAEDKLADSEAKHAAKAARVKELEEQLVAAEAKVNGLVEALAQEKARQRKGKSQLEEAAKPAAVEAHVSAEVVKNGDAGARAEARAKEAELLREEVREQLKAWQAKEQADRATGSGSSFQPPQSVFQRIRERKAPPNIMEMFEKCEIILSKFYYEGHEEDAFRDYRYLLPETDPDGAMAEALEALEAIRNDLKGASADIKIMLETKDVRKGYERFLEDKPDDMKGHWDVTDEKEFEKRMCGWARQLPKLVEDYLKAPGGYKYLRTPVLLDWAGEFNVCCAGHEESSDDLLE